MKSIGERIKFLRDLAGLTQETLAEMLGIDRAVLSNIERNERELKAEELPLFSNQLNVSVTQLLGIDPLPEVVLESGFINPTQNEHAPLRINVPAAIPVKHFPQVNKKKIS